MMDDDRKNEILDALMDDELWALVSVKTDVGDGTIHYEDGASRVGGEPCIEVPHDDPYIVDESTMEDPFTGEVRNIEGVSSPSKTWEGLLSEYGCIAKQHDAFTYVVVDEGVASKRP